MPDAQAVLIQPMPPPAADPPPRKLLSIVVPVHDEQEVLREFHARLRATLATLPASPEIIYVNDGSRDASLAVIRSLAEAAADTFFLDLARNFGKEAAITAGLDAARGDAVVVIDADLQDPPELIPQLFARWHGEGHDVVYAQRSARLGESPLKRLTARLFYRTINAVAEQQLPLDTGDFRLLSRRAVDSLNSLRERRRFMKGLFTWIGYSQVAVPYVRAPRAAGRSKWNFWKLWNFSLDGITAFSTLPLRVSSYLGLLAAGGAACYGLFILLLTLLRGNPVPGYPSLLVVVLFLGGIQLIVLGVIGEYLGRIFEETKQRPLYLVRESRLQPPPPG